MTVLAKKEIIDMHFVNKKIKSAFLRITADGYFDFELFMKLKTAKTSMHTKTLSVIQALL